MPALTPSPAAVGERRKRRWLLRLLVALNAVALLVVATELAAAALTEHWLAAQVRSATGAGEVTARIHSFPFALEVLVTGRAGRIAVTASDVPAGALTLARVSVDARRLHLDRRDLLGHGQVRVTSVDRAEITVEITTQELSGVVGHEVGVSSQNTLVVTVNGVALPLTVEIVDGHILTLGSAGHQLAAVDLTLSPVIPLCDLTVVAASGVVSLTCQVEPVPQSLVDALSDSLQG